MQVLISRWGHSQAIRIPSILLNTMQLGQGDAVTLRLLDSGELMVRPSKNSKLVPVEGSVKAVEEQVEEEW